MQTALDINPVAQKPIEAQEGSQAAFLRTGADIAVYGGAAGAGKSYALLLEPLYHVSNPEFGCVMFRRTYPQITSEGGLWDTSMTIYQKANAVAKQSRLAWMFPTGAKVKFAHMQYEQDRMQWDGAQIPLICWDQLEHFTWKQFFYMLARNRSTCGVKPYIRATCNPDPDHWLRHFMRWWIDDESGFPIKERSGVVRWFIIRDDAPIWADTPQILTDRYGRTSQPKSFTFIPGTVMDNRILLESDPSYLANLKALPNVDRQRLLGGNWNVRESAGEIFKKIWFEIVNAAPASDDIIRYWDRAATEAAEGTEVKASWTAGMLLSKAPTDQWYIKDMVRFQGSPLTVEQTIINTATQDGKEVRIGIEEDPGQAGKADAEHLVRMLGALGFIAHANRVHESKGVRAKAPSAQAEAGNIKLVRGAWNEAFLNEAENFDGTKKCTSDQIDTLSGGFYMLTDAQPAGTWGRG